MQQPVDSAPQHSALLSGGFDGPRRAALSAGKVWSPEMLYVLRQTAHLTTDCVKRPGLGDEAYPNGIYGRAERQEEPLSVRKHARAQPHLSKSAKRKKPKAN